jgi:uncharacterized protein YodC (DUF2158 family)
MSNGTIQKGNRVKLNSGGPEMTVEDIGPDPGPDPFGGGAKGCSVVGSIRTVNLQSGDFSPQSLMKLT